MTNWEELRAAAQDVMDNADEDSSPRSFIRLQAALAATSNDPLADLRAEFLAELREKFHRIGAASVAGVNVVGYEAVLALLSGE